jgi:hypothetical protein
MYGRRMRHLLATSLFAFVLTMGSLSARADVPPADSGPPADGGTSEDDGGCTITAARGSALALLVPLAAGAVIVARRRRR